MWTHLKMYIIYITASTYFDEQNPAMKFVGIAFSCSYSSVSYETFFRVLMSNSLNVITKQNLVECQINYCKICKTRFFVRVLYIFFSQR